MTKDHRDDSRDTAPTLVRDLQSTLLDAPAPPSSHITAVSMKTPDGIADQVQLSPVPAALPKVRIRRLAELGGTATPPRGVGRLAPPHDPRAARSRQLGAAVKWSLAVLTIAAVVTVAVLVLARLAA